MTYCDFKVGDEVVCVDARAYRKRGDIYAGCWLTGETGLIEGRVYEVRRVGLCPCGTPGIDVGLPMVAGGFNRSDRFRKVIRRDLSAWLETSTDFEEPKRVPAGADA